MFIARKADVLSIPPILGKSLVGDILFPEGSGFSRWVPTLGTANFKTTGKSAREGAYRSNILEFNFPLDKESLRLMLEQAEDDEFIVVYTLSNGVNKLFGTLEYPVKFQFNQDSGSEILSGIFNNCRFYYDGPDNTYFYAGAITEQTESEVGTVRVEFTDGTLIALLHPPETLVVASDFTHAFTHVPGTGNGLPSVVKWDTGEIIASLFPGDKLVVDTDFTDDLEIIHP